MTTWSIEATTIGLVKAGFPRNVELLTIATAVCWVESSFDPAITNPRGVHPPSNGAYGLFQILYQAHQSLFTKYKWDDGNDNCKMARSVYLAAGGSWHPWVGYTSGAYKAHLAECRIGVINGLKGDPGGVEGGIHPTLPSIPNPLDAIGALLGWFGGLLGKIFNPDLWRRIGLAVGGVFAIAIGIVAMVEGEIHVNPMEAGKLAAKVV